MSQAATNSGFRVTPFPATRTLFSQPLSTETFKKKVAGYARVSTDTEEQQGSYEMQVKHYTELIKGNPAWEFVDVYTDEGISGTDMRKRDGFNRMIQDALDGKIDLIETKSISRFARNTVDSLTVVRMLKDKGIEVHFEKEGIYTLDSKGELLITIMSSLAQEESRSISENVTWGIRKRFADGKFSMPYKQFLGYEKGPNGKPKIVESEAKTVRLIYQLFLGGLSTNAIAKRLTGNEIPTPAGKRVWQGTTVESILTNEKYKGEALLQKKFTVNFLTKERKLNNGELQQFYVENSHPAIIEPDVFDMVQHEMAKRKQNKHIRCGDSPFSARILCADCGHYYGRKTWHSGASFEKLIWRCNYKYAGKQKCTTPHFYEDELKAAFVRAFNQMITDKDEILQTLAAILDGLLDTEALEVNSEAVVGEIITIKEKMASLVEENARRAMNQGAYLQRFVAMKGELDALMAQRGQIEAELLARRARKAQIGEFMQTLNAGVMTEFDEEVFRSVVESIATGEDRSLTFQFIDGTEIKV